MDDTTLVRLAPAGWRLRLLQPCAGLLVRPLGLWDSWLLGYTPVLTMADLIRVARRFIPNLVHGA